MKPVLSLVAVVGVSVALAVGWQASAQEAKPAAGKAEGGKENAAQVDKGDAKTGKDGAKAEKGDAKKKPNVPPNFAKVDLTAAQREKLQAIQAAYYEKLEALKDQMKALDAQRDADCEAVLTAEQKERLAKLTAESKKKSAEKAAEKKKETEAKKEAGKPAEKKTEDAAKTEAAPKPAAPAKP